jgi:hypothetical protein
VPSLDSRSGRVLLQGLDAGRAIGLVVLGIGMLTVFGVGIVKISVATWHLAESVVGIGEQTAISSVTDYLKALEYFFLAPLGLLTFRALGAFVVVQLRAPDRGEPTTEEQSAESRLHALKTAIAGLIAALLATDLVSRVLATGGTRLADLDGELATLIVILVYVWVVSRRH